MGLTRDEMITLGLSLPTESLSEWASALANVARHSQERLQKRGMTAVFLQEIAKLVETVRSYEPPSNRGPRPEPPTAPSRIDRARDEALDWWREVKLAAKVEFGADPQRLSRFRTGVKLGGSLSKLASEIELLLPVVLQHREQLAWLGIDENFVRRGEALLGQLRDAVADEANARSALSPAAQEWNASKGLLFDLTRKLIRIGRLEFRKEPAQAALYAYDILRRPKARAPTRRMRAPHNPS